LEENKTRQIPTYQGFLDHDRSKMRKKYPNKSAPLCPSSPGFHFPAGKYFLLRKIDDSGKITENNG
jgi:hypothetical protein